MLWASIAIAKSPGSLWSGPRGASNTVAARLKCAYKFGMSIDARIKSRRGRPEVDSEEIRARVARPVLNAMDAWIAAQPEPRPSRPEAIRLALKDWLTGLGYLPALADHEGARAL